MNDLWKAQDEDGASIQSVLDLLVAFNIIILLNQLQELRAEGRFAVTLSPPESIPVNVDGDRGEEETHSRPVLYGVPQGSCLSSSYLTST